MTCTFDVLNSSGASFTVGTDVLNSSGASFAVGVDVLNSSGTLYTVGTCATPDTTANSGGGGRKRRQKLPFYEGNYGESRTVVDDRKPVEKKTDYAGKPLLEVPPELKQAKVEAKGELIGELVAKVQLPGVDKAEKPVDNSDIETAIVMLLLSS